MCPADLGDHRGATRGPSRPETLWQEKPRDSRESDESYCSLLQDDGED